jgi:hypothetical protein
MTLPKSGFAEARVRYVGFSYSIGANKGVRLSSRLDSVAVVLNLVHRHFEKEPIPGTLPDQV